MNLKATLQTVAFDLIWATVLVVGFPWLAWRYFKGKNRRGWSQKLLGSPPLTSISESRLETNSDRQRIWLHAVSVGEVHLLKTLIERLEQRQSVYEIHISTTTETGFDRANQLFGDRYTVFFFPFDFSWAIRRVVKRVRPHMLILAELELWPNLIHVIARAEIPIFVANARLSENSHRNYRRLGILATPMFRKLSFVAAQDEVYAERFVDLGCDAPSVSVVGNLKFDSICTDRDNSIARQCREVAAHFGMNESDSVLVAGSTQIEDEVVAIESWLALRNQFPLLKLIVVPRHPERAKELEALLRDYNVSASMRTDFGADVILDSLPPQDVLIVDVIGELSGWWALADVAFVGGSMGARGGQNMIEPAAYGIPVCFGPNTSNFKTTVGGLLANDAAKVVHCSVELTDFCKDVLMGSSSVTEMGLRSKSFVLQHRGATERTVDAIENLFSLNARRKSRAA